MKVLYIASFPSNDAPSRNIFNYRSAVELRQHADVHVLRLQYWRPGRRAIEHHNYKGFAVTSLRLPYLPAGEYMPGLLLPVWSWLAEGRLESLVRDVDIIHSVGVGLGGIVGAHLSKRMNKAHVTQAIGSDLLILLPKRVILASTKNWIYGVDLVLCNSKALNDEWRVRYPMGPESVVVYRGTDTKKFTSSRMVPDVARNFVFLGGLRRVSSTDHGIDVKGATSLMRVWRVLDDDPAFQGRLVFAGPNSDGDQVRYWRSMLKRPENVSLRGLVGPDEVKNLLEEADVTLLPSLSEGLPNVAVESAAMSRVVLASNVGGVPEIVEDNVTGRLLPVGDDDAWIRSIREAAGGKYPLTEWGGRARERVESKFDSSQYGAAIYELYTSVLSKRQM